MKRLFGIFVLYIMCISSTALFAEQKLRVQIIPGQHWLSSMKIFIFKKYNPPQIAAWIEDTQGEFVKNLYVTKCTAKETWISAPKEGRPEALPVWSHKQKSFLSSSDILSSASTKDCPDLAEVQLVLEKGKAYSVFLEVNASFDYNETWPKKAKKDSSNYSGVNGQPSLIYKCDFLAGSKQNLELQPFGVGSIDGSNGKILENLEGLTTALNIIESAIVLVD